MVKMKFLIICLISLFFIFPQSSVSAHVLESNGSIGAVMHVSPNDDPVVGEQSGFFFEFKDKEGKFKPELCDCTFTILQQGKELYSQPLFQNSTNPSLTDVSVFYTFPEKNIYTVQITGKPLNPDTFQPFTLTYDLRIERETDTHSSTDQDSFSAWIERHTFHIMGTIILLGLVGYSFYTNQLKRKRT